MAETLTGPKLRGATKVVEKYLTALEQESRPRGRRTVEWMENRYAEITQQLLGQLDVMDRLTLTQERQDLERDLAAAGEAANLETLTKDFISIAADWSRAKGINYSTWRLMKVPALVLKEAGIS
jgi:hypothetical protein